MAKTQPWWFPPAVSHRVAKSTTRYWPGSCIFRQHYHDAPNSIYPMLKKILLVGLGLFLSVAVAAAAERPARLLVLTDVENEPDDSESLVRLMLYTNVIDLEG